MDKMKETWSSIKGKIRTNRKASIAASCAAVLLAGTLVGLATCNVDDAKDSDIAGDMETSKDLAAQGEQRAEGETEPEGGDEPSGTEETPGGAADDASESTAVSFSEATASSLEASPSDTGSAGSTGNTPSGSAQSAEEPAPSEPERHWVEETEDVWVQDTAAWSEQVPIYATVEVSICNVCGADITGNTAAHAKAHMLAGEGSGHHSETRQTITGYETVEHAATGHWETCVVRGHWE